MFSVQQTALASKKGDGKLSSRLLQPKISLVRIDSDDGKKPSVVWVGGPIEENETSKKTFYRRVRIRGGVKAVGDFVSNTEGTICRIVNLHESKQGKV